MKLTMPRLSTFGYAAACSVAVLTSFAGTAKADAWDKKTIVTIDQPVQVTNTVLEPGQYVFKLLNSQSDRHVVQIFNADQTKIIDTILAVPNYRLQPTGKSRFAMWETPAGSVKALRAWFYPGDNFGQEFVYPAQLRQVAGGATVSTESPFHESEAAETVAANETPALAATASVASVETPAPAPAEPVTVATTAVVEAPAPAPAPRMASEATAQSAELPHTATPYPLVGLFGILSVGIFGLLRLKRAA